MYTKPFIKQVKFPNFEKIYKDFNSNQSGFARDWEWQSLAKEKRERERERDDVRESSSDSENATRLQQHDQTP